jgi:very-short-patch-repair endonuclease/predicted transcriptional regulator of viral defense system
VELALGQHGVFALWQVVALGIPERTVHQWAQDGRVHRVYQGVYALTPSQLLSPHALLMAAVQACGEDAALSHRSAADLLGLLRNRRARTDVTVPTRSDHRRPGLDIHRSITLIERDLVVVKSIRCTSVARTLLDIAPKVSEGQLTRAFDQSEILELFDLRAINDQLERNRTHPGARRIRALLADYEFVGQTRSEFERRLFPRIKAAGFALPRTNEWIVLDDGERAICVDFCWREQRLIVETDGKKTHLTHQAFERDRRDDQRLTAAGWTVIRITWKQLEREPDRIMQTIGALLSEAEAPRRRPLLRVDPG